MLTQGCVQHHVEPNPIAFILTTILMHGSDCHDCCRSRPGDNSTRTEIETNEYMQVVVYDHVTRRRS